MQLIDTHVLSELMRAQPDAGVMRWLEGRQRVNPQRARFRRVWRGVLNPFALATP